MSERWQVGSEGNDDESREWWVTDTQTPGRTFYFDLRPEAIAVRDALNRVAAERESGKDRT